MKLQLHQGTELSDVTLASAHVYSLIIEGFSSDGKRYQAGVTESVSPDHLDYLRPMVFCMYEFVDALDGPSAVCYVGIKAQESRSIDADVDAWFVEEQSFAQELAEKQSDLTAVLQQYFPGARFQEGSHDGQPLPTYKGAGCVILGELPADTPHLENVHMKIALVQSLAQRLGFTINTVYFETG